MTAEGVIAAANSVKLPLIASLGSFCINSPESSTSRWALTLLLLQIYRKYTILSKATCKIKLQSKTGTYSMTMQSELSLVSWKWSHKFKPHYCQELTQASSKVTLYNYKRLLGLKEVGHKAINVRLNIFINVV